MTSTTSAWDIAESLGYHAVMWIRRVPPVLRTTFVDEDKERAKLGLLLAAMAAFLVSGWYSFQELKYAVWGTLKEATVTRMYEFTVPTRRGKSRPRLGVEYAFTDADGDQRADKDWVPLPSPLQNRATVAIQYLPGNDGDSRLADNRSIFGPLIFVSCMGFVVISLFQLIREANAPLRSKRKRRRQRSRGRK